VVVGILSAPLDLPVFVGVPAILLVVATLASWWPARRITRVDPMLALRAE
jgi:ABC-type lipoprotein release transport system permease subunit